MFIFALTPAVAVSLPAIIPIVAAVAGAMGYKVMVDMKEGGDINDALYQRLHETTTVQVKVDDLVLEHVRGEVARGQSMYFVRDGIQLALIVDERGRARVEASAPEGTDERLLREEGRAFAEQIGQLFAYNKAAAVIEQLNAEIMDEERTEDGEIRLRISRWRE
jgi:hypothetical protein